MQDYREIMISATQAPTLRRIVKHGLEDCERRLEKMAEAKSDAARDGEEWTKYPESINNEMYKEAKGIVQQEVSVLRMLWIQLEPKEKERG